MKYYATINSENICDGISQLNDKVISDNLIELTSYDTSVIGKMWTGSEWVDNPNPPEPQLEPVTNEDIDAKLTDTQNIVLDAMSGMGDLYETTLTNQEMQLDTMSGIADLFDLMLTTQGGN